MIDTGGVNLKKELTPLLLWGLGVGYVISGMYFGWNLGLKEGGTLGMAIATFFSIILYTFFSFSYAELACAIPKAGGVFDYALHAFGKEVGFIAGIVQMIEFIFAPPAIALGIAAYFNLFFPAIPVIWIAIIVYILFTGLNIYGIKAAASFELLITMVAVIELLIFTAVTLPHFKTDHLQQNAFPNGWSGVLAAIPFAIWFFLGIEGLANVAEETKNPQKDISRGFGSSIFTLVVLCILIFISSIGVGGWQTIVYKNGHDGVTSDSPLPLAMATVVGHESWLFHMLLTIGIFGLIASFHGLILASGRSTYEFGKSGFGPRILGRIHSKFKTPALALLVNMGIGILAILTNKTGEIITLSVLGAVTLYMIALFSLFKLRKTEASMHRPYVVPFFPWIPGIALTIAMIALIAIVYFNAKLALIYLAILAISFISFKFFPLHTLKI